MICFSPPRCPVQFVFWFWKQWWYSALQFSGASRRALLRQWHPYRRIIFCHDVGNRWTEQWTNGVGNSALPDEDHGMGRRHGAYPPDAGLIHVIQHPLEVPGICTLEYVTFGQKHWCWKIEKSQGPVRCVVKHGYFTPIDLFTEINVNGSNYAKMLTMIPAWRGWAGQLVE